MAHEIFRIDLSEAACDFQSTATEPGLPMLDSAGSNDALLCRWLGDLVPEPEWRPDLSVAFYVRHGQWGRLEEVECRPTSKEDLEGPLREQVERLAEGIRRANPTSSNERLLHKIVRQTFDRLRSDPERADAGFFLMKYRVGKDPWRLIWCWGYQRIDNRPAQPVICRNPECKLLFAHRQGTKALCPGCQSVTARKRRRGGGFAAWRAAVLALCLLLLLAAILAPWWWPRVAAVAGAGGGGTGRNQQPSGGDGSGTDGRRLGADKRAGGGADAMAGVPAALHLAVGERFDFELGEQVNSEVSIQSTDSSVVYVDSENCLEGRQPGAATIELSLGGRKRTVPVDVSAAAFIGLRIEPAGVAMALANADNFRPYPPVGTPDGKGGSTTKMTISRETNGIDSPTVRVPIAGGPHAGSHSDGSPDNPGRPDPGIPQTLPTVPVAVTSWRPVETTAERFVPELELLVNQQAEYRIVGRDGTLLSRWQGGGPGAPLVIRGITPVDCSTDGEYELVVERRLPGGQVRQFAVPLTLKPTADCP